MKSGKEKVTKHLEAAMRAALNDDDKAVKALLEQAGSDAVLAVQLYMRNGTFEPLKPSTIKNRNRSRLTKGERENEQRGENIKPLINSGALQNALDFYVEDGDGWT